eukprot:TRINITY_DN21760_c0_g1_i1.p1 TRINITY_DN21760_c0_g1~~TRINITY_DN21760_c0_g1_i1.p1  ORF type:complete len:167 (-),score=35.51 TRINITY_DN21760_c0_g1_i1:4-504(-)
MFTNIIFIGKEVYLYYQNWLIKSLPKISKNTNLLLCQLDIYFLGLITKKEIKELILSKGKSSKQEEPKSELPSIEDVQKMSIKQIKDLASTLNIDLTDLLEKAEILEKVVKEIQSRQNLSSTQESKEHEEPEEEEEEETQGEEGWNKLIATCRSLQQKYDAALKQQ